MQPIKEFINNPMKQKFCEKDCKNSLAIGVIIPAILVNSDEMKSMFHHRKTT